MDWVGLASAIGVSSIVTAIVGYVQGRRINAASALKTDAEAKSQIADYAAKIIEQADERVRQSLDDKKRAIEERDAAYIETKAQRKAKQEHRENWLKERSLRHECELKIKETEAALNEQRWYRCEAMACAKRIPPRKEEP